MHPELMRMLAIERQLSLLESAQRLCRHRQIARPKRHSSRRRRRPIPARISIVLRHPTL